MTDAAPPPPAGSAGSGLSWPITTVLVLLGLSTLAVVLDLLVGVLFGGIAVSALDTVAASGEYASFARELQAGLVLAGITDVALLAFLGWASRAVHRGVAVVRPLLVVKAVAEAVVTIAFHALSGSTPAQTTVIVIGGLLFDAVMLALLWVPRVARRHFGDQGASPTIADLWPPLPSVTTPAAPATTFPAPSPLPAPMPPTSGVPVAGPHGGPRHPSSPAAEAPRRHHYRPPAPAPAPAPASTYPDDEPVTVRIALPRPRSSHAAPHTAPHTAAQPEPQP